MREAARVAMMRTQLAESRASQSEETPLSHGLLLLGGDGRRCCAVVMATEGGSVPASCYVARKRNVTERAVEPLRPVSNWEGWSERLDEIVKRAKNGVGVRDGEEAISGGTLVLRVSCL